MKTIIFNRHCIGWTNDFEITRRYLANQRSYLNDLLIHRGYVYLNQIYECLGVKWNPDDENICYRKESGFLDMRFKPMDYDAILIEIH